VEGSEMTISDLVIADSGNVLFYGQGKPCAFCNCWFSSSRDYNLHRKVCPKPPEWKVSSFDDMVEICRAESDSRLKATIVQNGKSLVIGDFEYSLNQKQTFIKRRRI
jgi:hypothetical protein